MAASVARLGVGLRLRGRLGLGDRLEDRLRDLDRRRHLGLAGGSAGAASASTSISVPRGFVRHLPHRQATRRRDTSTSITLTWTSSPTDSTDSGVSTCSWLSSEMCTKPSMPGATRTNAPNGTSFVTCRR